MRQIFIAIIILCWAVVACAQERIIWDSDPSDGDAPCIVLATGHFLPCTPGGAPDLSAEPFITKTTSANLSAEFALSSLATGILINTTGTGIPTIYPGTSCTNQFPRSLSASGVATCASVDIAADVSGLGTGVATFLGTPSSANFLSAITDEVGSGSKVAKFDSVSGNSGVAGQTSGTLTPGNLAKFDASGNIIDSGATATAAVFSGACVGRSVDQSINDSTVTTLTWDSEAVGTGCGYDTDNFHFTSSAALTGTVSKSSGSPTITGSGTSFTTELTVNQVISVPGTAAEYCVVIAIGTNTSLTCKSNMANTASGQTATRVNSTFTIPAAGKYEVFCVPYIDTTAAAKVEAGYLYLNGAEVYENIRATGSTFNEPIPDVRTILSLAQYDFIECKAYQASGGTRNVKALATQAYYSKFIIHASH